MNTISQSPVVKVQKLDANEQFVANIILIEDGSQQTLMYKAPTEEAARARILREHTHDGEIAVKIVSIKPIKSVLKGIEKKSWSMSKLIEFTKNYTALARSRIPQQQILEILYRETKDIVILKLLYEVAGRSRYIDEAMEMMPKVFPKDYRGAMKASRDISDMHEIMNEISTILIIKNKIRTQIDAVRSNIVTPILVTFLVLFATSLYSTPEIISLYTGFHASDSQMPTMTLELYSVVIFLVNFAVYFISLVIVAMGPVAYMYKNSGSWRYFIDELILSSPVI